MTAWAQTRDMVRSNIGVRFLGASSPVSMRAWTQSLMAALQFISKSVLIGIAGYHFQQLIGDSGAGATLGEFKVGVRSFSPTSCVLKHHHRKPALPALIEA